MRIGVCDDASTDGEMLAGLCRRFDPELSPEVAVFTLGQSLLDAYDRGERFDILFLDVEMPGLTGLEVDSASVSWMRPPSSFSPRDFPNMPLTPTTARPFTTY